MNAGPATKMYEALMAIAEGDDSQAGAAAWMAVEGIPPATLEAMDAAAEVMGRNELAHQVRVGIRSTYRDADDFDLCTHTVSLSLPEEQELLWTLLEREIQRRKEPEAKHA